MSGSPQHQNHNRDIDGNMSGYFDQFRTDLAEVDLPARLRAGLIGEGASFDGPFGPREIV